MAQGVFKTVPSAYNIGLTFDDAKFVTAIRSAISSAVDVEIGRIETDAKRFAPVRKIFSSGKIGRMTRTATRRAPPRFLTAAEIKDEAGIRARLGLAPAVQGVSRVASTRRPITSTSMDADWYASLSPQKQRNPRSGKRMRQLAEADLRLAQDYGNKSAGTPQWRGLQKSAYQFLTARGMYEVRNAKKRGSLVKVEASGTEEGSQTYHVGGRLKSEIRRVPGRWSGHVYIASVQSPTPYAKYVEFGTHHAPAQPYLRPALHRARGRFRDTMQRAIDNADMRQTARTDAGGNNFDWKP